MSQALSIEAESREVFGKNASRRLRHAGRVPAVVYGDQGPSLPVTVTFLSSSCRTTEATALFTPST